METLSTLKDIDSTWALKIKEPKEDSDDSSSMKPPHKESVQSDTNSHPPLPPADSPPIAAIATVKAVARERKHSLPLSARILVMETSPTNLGVSDSIEHRPKDKLRILVNLSNQFLQTDPTTLAQEISRLESKFFLQIKVC